MAVKAKFLAEPLVCPACKAELTAAARGAKCDSCGRTFERNSAGYLQFPVSAGGAAEAGERLESYAAGQEESAERFYSEFLRPYVAREPVMRILDAGCGTGAAAEKFEKDGFESFGIDLPKASEYWKRAGRSPDSLFVGDVEELPFVDSSFDVVLSIGVIEHVGTVTGHCTLAPDFRERRRRYARDLVRVARPGARILVACPNKSFPVDLAHGPLDSASRPLASSTRARAAVHRATGANVHKTWGDYHLVSYGDVRRLFVEDAGAASIRPVPARGYFAFESVRAGILRDLARSYVEGLPKGLRTTGANPFVIAQVRR